jgi:hypothetical protein
MRALKRMTDVSSNKKVDARFVFIPLRIVSALPLTIITQRVRCVAYSAPCVTAAS